MSLADEMRKLSKENQPILKEPNYDAAYKSLLECVKTDAKSGKYKSQLPLGFPMPRSSSNEEFREKISVVAKALMQRFTNDEFKVKLEDDFREEKDWVNFWLDVSW